MNSLLKLNTAKNTIAQVSRISASGFGVTAANKSSFKVQDDKDFLNKVENSKETVIVDFFANWCGPCKALEPRLESVIAKRKSKVTFAKVDIDSLTDLAEKYEVGTISALVVFRNEKVEERLVGLQDEDKLGIWVDEILERNRCAIA